LIDKDFTLKCFRFRKQEIVLIIIFSLLCFAYYQWTWSTILAGPGGDNAVYLLTAKYFSPYSEYSSVASYFAHVSPYPPLYPLMLALLGGGESLLVAHLITTSFLLLSFLIFYYWLTLEKLTLELSLLVVLVFSILPGIYMQALSVHSENLYILLTLLSLLSVSIFEQKQEQRWLWIAVFAIGMASLTRSAGVTLIAAFVLYLWSCNQQKKWMFSLCSVIPFILWKIFGVQAGISYTENVLKLYSAAPIETLISQLSIEMKALWHGWQTIFSLTQTGSIFLLAVALISLLGTGLRILQKKIDGYYVLCYVLLILVWPFPAEAQRFTLVITPILLFHGVYFISHVQISRLKSYQSWVLPVLFLSLITIQVLPDLVLAAQRFQTKLPEKLQAFRHHSMWYRTDLQSAYDYIDSFRAIDKTMIELSTQVAEDQCIFAVKPSIMAYHSNRMSKSPPIASVSARVFDREIENDGCQYFYFSSISAPSFHTQFYPMDRLENRVEIVSVGYVDKHEDKIVGMLGVLKETD